MSGPVPATAYSPLPETVPLPTVRRSTPARRLATMLEKGIAPAPNPAVTAITERSRATFAHVAFHQARGRNSSDDRWARGREDTPKLAGFTVLLNLGRPNRR